MTGDRRLDAEVAERVMGWREISTGTFEDEYGGLHTLEATSYGQFSPSTNIADAWLVVEKLGVSVGPRENGKWWAGKTAEFGAIADTAPEAICKAALAALRAAEGA